MAVNQSSNKEVDNTPLDFNQMCEYVGISPSYGRLLCHKKEIPFHKDGSLMLVKRGNEMHIPHGDTHLRTGDIVTVFGTDSAIEDFMSKLI